MATALVLVLAPPTRVIPRSSVVYPARPSRARLGAGRQLTGAVRRVRARSRREDDDTVTASEKLNVWDSKPLWCQPWTIVATGTLGVVASWLLFRSLLVTPLVTVLVGAWWYIFLYLYPLEYEIMNTRGRQRPEETSE